MEESGQCRAEQMLVNDTKQHKPPEPLWRTLYVGVWRRNSEQRPLRKCYNVQSAMTFQQLPKSF